MNPPQEFDPAPEFDPKSQYGYAYRYEGDSVEAAARTRLRMLRRAHAFVPEEAHTLMRVGHQPPWYRNGKWVRGFVWCKIGPQVEK